MAASPAPVDGPAVTRAVDNDVVDEDDVVEGEADDDPTLDGLDRLGW